MTEALARRKLPVDWQNQIVYYLVPTRLSLVTPIGSADSTTAGRMDAYTPTMLAQGIKAMIGKGSRSKEVVEAMKTWRNLPCCCWRCCCFNFQKY